MDAPEVSVVMPCLDEADTLARCVGKAQKAFAAAGIRGEVVVADNGSTDNSPAIAEGLGARVVHVAERGYGSALMGGIEAARADFVVMGDADDSYDFAEVPRFLDRLRAGDELVQGCRLPRGGGRVMPGAMPFLHYWIGNPLFSLLVREGEGAVRSVDATVTPRPGSPALEVTLDGHMFTARVVSRFGGRAGEGSGSGAGPQQGPAKCPA
jgi:glycosyltransferase involved in cell wall biosynthesis